MVKFIEKYYLQCLLVILAFSFIVRIVNITNPQTYIFDEVYHAITAKLIARDDPRAYEWWNPAVEPNTAVDWLHPPLAKYFQATGILIFGENVLGWRISSVIFGVFVIAAIAKLTYLLFRNKPISLLAATLASFDGLLLAQSRIAMNDIHVTFFVLLTLIFYVKHRDSILDSKKLHSFTKYLVLTGISAGLAMGSKWSGIYILVPIYLFEFLHLIQNFKKNSNSSFLFIIQRFIFLCLLPICIYILCYAHMFIQGKTLICTQQEPIQGVCYYEEFKDFSGEKIIWKGYVSHFVELHRQIWWYQTNLEATHPYQSRPWQWFLNLKPVWFYVDYQGEKRADIYAQGNTVLFWIGDVSVLVVCILLLAAFFKDLKNKKVYFNFKDNNTKLILLVITYASMWLPWQFSPRIMFFYHYTPAVPFLCIITAYALYKLLESKTPANKALFTTAMILIFACFIIFYPHWTGIPMSNDLKEVLYFGISSWK